MCVCACGQACVRVCEVLCKNTRSEALCLLGAFLEPVLDCPSQTLELLGSMSSLVVCLPLLQPSIFHKPPTSPGVDKPTFDVHHMPLVLRPPCLTRRGALLRARERRCAPPAPHRRCGSLDCITTFVLATFLYGPRTGCARASEVLLELNVTTTRATCGHAWWSRCAAGALSLRHPLLE